MPMTPSATVAQAIKARLAALDTGAAEPDQDAALEALVDEIRKMVLAGTVTVPATGLVSPGGLTPAPVTGAATGSIT